MIIAKLKHLLCADLYKKIRQLTATAEHQQLRADRLAAELEQHQSDTRKLKSSLMEQQEQQAILARFAASLDGYHRSFSTLQSFLAQERHGLEQLGYYLHGLDDRLTDMGIRDSLIKSALLAEIELANIEEFQLMVMVQRMVLGHIEADERQVVSVEECGIGRWYYSSLFQRYFGATREFQALETPHQQVHEFALQALQAFRNNDPRVVRACLLSMENANQTMCQLIERMTNNLLSTSAAPSANTQVA
ncbi:CZB domain-containing protein [Lacimicrobium alkaliphilum]|uniref:Chemoreceptor zinc-binding domain-containing protein n=1 Tax=Lacimicrobium alkaliphilum TaxID=1526571 RepID=A0A0U3AAK8_9ALTE|nr:CZB domain-containing protein [Lacimicrobium alkaliphilum]ALS98046.1 hypothetical protein AT746_07065 [Lacimicrobium alkaliphilum]